MCVQRLTLARRSGLLQMGERVTFLEATNVHPGDLGLPDPDIPVPDVIVPAGATAVVCINTLRQDGLIALDFDVDPYSRATKRCPRCDLSQPTIW